MIELEMISKSILQIIEYYPPTDMCRLCGNDVVVKVQLPGVHTHRIQYLECAHTQQTGLDSTYYVQCVRDTLNIADQECAPKVLYKLRNVA